MKIAGIVSCSTVDYPGKLAAVLFSPGCNYDCGFCHNRHLLLPDAPCMRHEAVWDFLNKRRGLLDAVVFSGGEPTLQKGLADFMRQVKALGFSVKLDTNGSNPHILKRLLLMGLPDYVAVDYKAPWSQYARICGRNAQTGPVKRTLEILRASNIPWELRTTLLPDFSLVDYERMAQEITPPPRYVCNRYREPEPSFRQGAEHTPQILDYHAAVHTIFKQYMPDTEIII